MFDLLISGGKIYDGSGGKAYTADVAVKKDKIVGIGNFAGFEAKHYIDAEGLAVLPGFIDVHTHVDAELFSAPERAQSLCQGITTEIAGACGIGLFPLRANGEKYTKTVAGLYGCVAPHFKTCGEYLESLPSTGVNVAIQLAHSPWRFALCGFEDCKIPLHKGLDLARQAFEDGACALSTGLAYYPAAFGDTDEVAALARIATEFDAPLCVHQRTALRTPDPSFNPREEVLDFARKSGVRVQFSHYRTTPGTAGELDKLLEPIERGLAEGLKINADFYPYPVGAGYAAVNLPMRMMTGGFEHIMERLRRGDKFEIPGPMKNAVITHAPENPEYIGHSFREIEKNTGKEFSRLLFENKLALGYRLSVDFPEKQLDDLDKDFVALMQKPYYMFGSDSLPGLSLPHPRSRGAFARLLRLAAVNNIDMALFANRASGLPAEIFGLERRGIIAENNFADICIFNPADIKDNATFEQPRRMAEGMKWVVVNGQIAVKNGRVTETLAGQAVRRGKIN